MTARLADTVRVKDVVAWLEDRAKSRYNEEGTDGYGRRALEMAAFDIRRYGLPSPSEGSGDAGK